MYDIWNTCTYLRINGIEPFLSRFHIDRPSVPLGRLGTVKNDLNNLSTLLSLRAASSATDSLTFSSLYCKRSFNASIFLVLTQILFVRESVTVTERYYSCCPFRDCRLRAEYWRSFLYEL